MSFDDECYDECYHCGGMYDYRGCTLCVICNGCGDYLPDPDPEEFPKCKDCKIEFAVFCKKEDAKKAGRSYNPDNDFELSRGKCKTMGCNESLSAGYRCRSCVPCNFCGNNVDIPYDDFDTALCKACDEHDFFPKAKAEESEESEAEAEESEAESEAEAEESEAEESEAEAEESEAEAEESEVESEEDFIADCPFCGGLVTIAGCTFCIICSCGDEVRDPDPEEDFPKCKNCKLEAAKYLTEFRAKRTSKAAEESDEESESEAEESDEESEAEESDEETETTYVRNFPSGLYYTGRNDVHRVYYSNARLSSTVSFYFKTKELAMKCIETHRHMMNESSDMVLLTLALYAPESIAGGLTELRKYLVL